MCFEEKEGKFIAMHNAISQNKRDANVIKIKLQPIVPHCYGDHTKCGEWCRHLND